MKIKFFKSISFLVALVATSTLASVATAHDGRRLDIQVINDQLFAQGFLSNPTATSDDGGGVVRPYFNVIHDHVASNFGTSVASLPGFDILDKTPLLGSDVTLTLLGASKWTPPARDLRLEVQDFGTPVLESLSDSEIIRVGLAGSDQSQIDSNDLGSFTLASDISQSEDLSDIDLNYFINLEPEGTIYALRWQLSTTQLGIADSGDVYTLLAPDGTGFDERLHFQTLALESFLGVTATAIPEPSSLALLGIAMVPITLRRRR